MKGEGADVDAALLAAQKELLSAYNCVTLPVNPQATYIGTPKRKIATAGEDEDVNEDAISIHSSPESTIQEWYDKHDGTSVDHTDSFDI